MYFRFIQSCTMPRAPLMHNLFIIFWQCIYSLFLYHYRNGLDMQIRLAIRMAVVVGTDFICWMPIIIMGLLSATGAAEIPADMYAWTAVFILPLNSSLNPYLYTFSVAWQNTKAKRSSDPRTLDTSEERSNRS